ncbi:MAG: PilN domain-containing protein [Actinobacteria bacterium]|nr:PilN domain-containing protein [Actinomycetota bacterium]
MTRINLLPPEIAQRQRARRQTTVVAAIALVVVLLLAFFYVLQQITLGGIDRDLKAQRDKNADLQAQVDELKRFDEIIAEIGRKEELLATLLRNEVRWSGVLRDLSLVVPGDAWLLSMDASVEDVLGTSSVSATSSDIIGSISFTGVADRHPTVAEWLTALEKIRGFLNPWISESVQGNVETVPVVQFTSTVDLTTDVTVEGRNET